MLADNMNIQKAIGLHPYSLEQAILIAHAQLSKTIDKGKYKTVVESYNRREDNSYIAVVKAVLK